MIYGGMCRVIWRLAKLLHAANKMYHMPQQRAPIVSSIINQACWSKNVLRYHKGLLQNTTICYILNSLCVRWFSFQPVSPDPTKYKFFRPIAIQNWKIQPCPRAKNSKHLKVKNSSSQGFIFFRYSRIFLFSRKFSRTVLNSFSS